jgi:hypothetical protein
MVPEHPAWVAYQRARWMRPDAERYWRPDAARYMTPETARVVLPDSMLPAERKDDARVLPALSLARTAHEERQRKFEILRLKSQIAALLFEKALVLHIIALQRKALHPSVSIPISRVYQRGTPTADNGLASGGLAVRVVGLAASPFREQRLDSRLA